MKKRILAFLKKNNKFNELLFIIKKSFLIFKIIKKSSLKYAIFFLPKIIQGVSFVRKNHNNMVCSGATTRLEVTSELLAILGLDNKIKITEVHSDYWKKDYYAPRPDCEILVNKNLDALKLNIMRNWKICLKEYIEDSYANYF